MDEHWRTAMDEDGHCFHRRAALSLSDEGVDELEDVSWWLVPGIDLRATGGSMTTLPGEPMDSGMRWLSDEEQEEFRKQHETMMKRLQPRLDEMNRALRPRCCCHRGIG